MRIPIYPGLSLNVLGAHRVGILELSRPDKSNAFNEGMWSDFSKAMHWLNDCTDINAVIIQGQGRNFCGGIDLEMLGGLTSLVKVEDPARASAACRRNILTMQESFNAIEDCRWPVIAAIQGACIGAGLDLIAACDIRICSKDVTFCLKEVDLAIPADLGSLQRLPQIIGYGRTVEMALTARKVSALEAQQIGLVTRICGDVTALHSSAKELAVSIAKKSPLAATGAKRVLQHARDHKVAEGLEYVATWNAGQALSNDLKEVFTAVQAKRSPSFSKL